MIDTFAVAQIAAQILAGAIQSPQYLGVASDDRFVLAAVQAAHKILAVAADPAAAVVATSMP
ncbi:MAG: hypothetical protein GWN58_36740, partial [Anaerolineae bacterium]|nr:hypothetical protein [Anaerolineae bacterium]